jgi:hypothetical protein
MYTKWSRVNYCNLENHIESGLYEIMESGIGKVLTNSLFEVRDFEFVNDLSVALRALYHD